MKTILSFLLLLSVSWALSLAQFDLNFQHTSLVSGLVVFDWESDNENNMDYYVVLRSGPGTAPVSEIGMVNAFGTTTGSVAYSFTDSSAFDPGEYCYSLKGVVLDGSFILAPADTAACETPLIAGLYNVPGKISFSLFPNPARNEFNIVSDIDEGDLEVWDMDGKCVFRYEWNTMVHASVSTDHWPAGIYTVLLRAPEGTVTRKIVIE